VVGEIRAAGRFGFGSEEESPAVNNFEEDYLESGRRPVV